MTDRIALHGMALRVWRDGDQVASVPLSTAAALGLLADLAEALARQQGRQKIESSECGPAAWPRSTGSTPCGGNLVKED